LDELRKAQDEANLNKRNAHTAANFIIEQIHKYPNEVVLVCLGALTNVATALKIDPKIAPLVKV
jgi:purine nucleosidase